MIGIVIAAHADLGVGLLNAVRLIAGEQTNVRTVGLFHGDGIDEFYAKVKKAINDVEEGEGVLVFNDFLGGTPANTVLRCMREKEFPCIVGVNMPMLLEAFLTRPNMDNAWQLADYVYGISKDSIVRLEEVYASSINASGDINDEDF
ncbi:MAG: PTS N-acetylglucosamine transporter subunit IIC [Erysipelotrichaceae bacterium]|nr:PTS N-acetylglucosamine transporter subunit IIC [Erysipelotrichaceae bacterium]